MTNNGKLSIFYFILGISLLFFSFKFFGSLFDVKSQQRYKQGLELYNKQDYQNAYYNFKKVSLFSPLSPLALYRQATCADFLEDNNNAIRKYNKFSKIFKDKEIAPAAIWRSGLISLRSQDKKNAKKQFLRIEDKYPEGDFAKAALYQLALFEEINDRQKAKSYLIDYIEYAPYGRYVLSAVQTVESYSDIKLNENDKLVLAQHYYNNADYNKSLNYLGEVSKEKSWYLACKNYAKLGLHEQFRSNLQKGLSFKNTWIEQKDLSDLLSLYLSSFNSSQKLLLAELLPFAKDTKNYPLILFAYSKYLNSASALKNYNLIFKNYPNSIVAPDSLWYVFWDFYKKKNYTDALRVAKYADNVYEDHNIQPRIMFWSAKIEAYKGHKKNARQIFQNLLNKYPDSYYAFRSKAELEKVKNPWLPVKIVEIRKNYTILPFPSSSDSKADRLFAKFAKVNDYKAIEDFKPEDEYIKSWLAAQNGLKSYSVLLARDALKATEDKPLKSNPEYKLAYPVYFEDFINKYSSEYDINPYIILALVREESYFDKNAKSPVGAIGLMQLMPETARMISQDTDINRLYEPEYNIYLGIKYFNYLLKTFKGNIALSILAYNSGPGNVKKWLQDSKTTSFDEFIEDIPYTETNNYIKRVYASYWNYIRIYRQK